MVLDDFEHGASGASVHLASVPPMDAMTDARGRFHLDVVACQPEAMLIIAAQKELKGSSTADCGKFTTIRLESARSRTLNVKDAANGQAVADAEAAITQQGVAPVVTNEAGAVSIDQYDPFFAAIEIKANGYADHTVQSGSEISAAQTQVLLRRGAVASGRVTNKQGEGVGGVTVYIELDATNASTTPLFSETDASGLWKHRNLPKGLYQFFILDKRIGHAASAPIRITDAAPLMGLNLVGDGQIDEASIATSDVRAERAAAFGDREVHGRVVDASGTPIPGAQIYIHMGDAAEVDDVLCNFAEEQMTADSDGLFTITNLPQGAAYTWASPPNTKYLSCPRLQDISPITQDTTHIRVVVPDGGTIKGRVVFAQGGSPAAFDLLQDGRFKSYQRKLTQEPNGVFSITTFAPGTADFDLVGPDFVTAQVACNVVAGGITDVGVITVEHGRETFGQVVSAAGTPVADAEVRPTTRAIHPPMSSVADMSQRQTFTDKDGRYALAGLETTDLQAYHPVWGVGSCSNAADGNATIVLRPAGSICGIAQRLGGFTKSMPLSLRAKDNAVLASTSPTLHGLYCFENLPADLYCFQDRSELSPCRILESDTQFECPIEDGELKDDAICVQVHVGEDVRLDLNFSDTSAQAAAAAEDAER